MKHEGHAGRDKHNGHSRHSTDHSGHEWMFRTRLGWLFRWCWRLPSKAAGEKAQTAIYLIFNDKVVAAFAVVDVVCSEIK